VLLLVSLLLLHHQVWHVPCGGVTYGDDNLVFIANDWHTALLPVYLQVGLQADTWAAVLLCNHSHMRSTAQHSAYLLLKHIF
jgi:hypothetical protein